MRARLTCSLTSISWSAQVSTRHWLENRLRSERERGREERGERREERGREGERREGERERERERGRALINR